MESLPVLIKSIFVPTKRHYGICRDSILNNLNNLRSQISEIYVVGWVGKQFRRDMEKYLLYLQKCTDIQIRTELWSGNFGKYYLFKNIKLDHQNYLYLDHDILLSGTLPDYRDLNHMFGILYLNQKGDCRHKHLGEIHVVDGHRVSQETHPGAFASGAFISTRKVMQEIQDKIELKSVYGLDDYHISKISSEAGYRNGLLIDTYVHHPPEPSEEYTEWKAEQIRSVINGKTNYGRSIEEANNFWIYTQ